MTATRRYGFGQLLWILACVMVLALQGGTTSGAAPLNSRDWATTFAHHDSGLFGQSSPRPDVCFQSDVPQETRRVCDQAQFAGEPHYNLVRVATNFKVRSIHLLRTDTGEKVFAAYPSGIAFAAPDNFDRELRIKTRHLERVLNVLRHLEQTPSPSPMGYASGLPIGWNNSSGVTPGQCLNYTIATPSNNVEQASSSSRDTARSTAEQVNVSATVSGAYGASPAPTRPRWSRFPFPFPSMTCSSRTRLRCSNTSRW